MLNLALPFCNQFEAATFVMVGLNLNQQKHGRVGDLKKIFF